MLSLPEGLMLLALDGKKGTVVPQAIMILRYGLMGAALMELIMSDHLAKREEILHPAKTRYNGDDMLHAVLREIRKSDGDRNISHWINHLSRKINLKHLVSARLAKRRILRHQEHKILWVINTNRYPTRDPKPRQEVLSGIHDVVLKNKQPNEHNVVLLALMQKCELVDVIFDKEDREQAKLRIDEIVSENETGKVISQIMDAIQTTQSRQRKTCSKAKNERRKAC
jgi:golgi phosphoprotein 3